tara:strand:+ start:172 stop:381 length:210 start_codon:yes stop_codon:yes gene_type:complete
MNDTACGQEEGITLPDLYRIRIDGVFTWKDEEYRKIGEQRAIHIESGETVSFEDHYEVNIEDAIFIPVE